jgi:hypothetical protein
MLYGEETRVHSRGIVNRAQQKMVKGNRYLRNKRTSPPVSQGAACLVNCKLLADNCLLEYEERSCLKLSL